jgi:hypothetical protein
VTYSKMPGGSLRLLTATRTVPSPACSIRDIAAALGAPPDVLKQAETARDGQTLMWRA